MGLVQQKRVIRRWKSKILILMVLWMTLKIKKVTIRGEDEQEEDKKEENKVDNGNLEDENGMVPNAQEDSQLLGKTWPDAPVNLNLYYT